MDKILAFITSNVKVNDQGVPSNSIGQLSFC